MSWMKGKMNASMVGAVLLGLSTLVVDAQPTTVGTCESIPGCRAELLQLRSFDRGQPAEERVGRSLARLARRADNQLTLADAGDQARRATHLARAERLLARLTEVAGRAYVAGTLGRESRRVATTAAHLAGLLAAPRVVLAPSAYTNNCAICHGATAGGGIGPKIQCRRNIAGVVRNGTGSMPAFSAAQVSDTDIVDMEAWLATFCTSTTSTSRPPGATTTTTRPGPAATTTTTLPPGRGGDDDDGEDDGEDDRGGLHDADFSGRRPGGALSRKP